MAAVAPAEAGFPNKPVDDDVDARWEGSVIIPIGSSGHDAKLQVAGAGDPNGHTCYVRILCHADAGGISALRDRNIGVQDIVSNVVRLVEDLRLAKNRERETTQRQNIISAAGIGGCSSVCIDKEKDGSVSATSELISTTDTSSSAAAVAAAADLVKIGAVWIVPVVASAPQNSYRKKCSRRARRMNSADATTSSFFDNNINLTEDVIIRIHHGAIRYRKVYQFDWGKKKMCQTTTVSSKSISKKESSQSSSTRGGVIIHEDLSVGYAIIDKPSGVPVHGYVYNNRENVANCYERSLIERYPEEEASSKFGVSVPQRLDRDTSGVLVVATKSSFASYMGKLLEAKTLTLTSESGARTAFLDTGDDSAFSSAIKKQYKCLVCLHSTGDAERLLEFARSGDIVTHYLSSQRTLPRIFKETRDDGTSGSWLECRLRIIAAGFDASTPYIEIQGSSAEANEFARRLWKGCSKMGCFDSFIGTQHAAVTEVHVELLTGRTHQIRGQMSALGFPLVGDYLYGGVSTCSSSRADTSSECMSQMGLHCCQLSFLMPIISEGKDKKRTYTRLHPSTEYVTFSSNCAWWN